VIIISIFIFRYILSLPFNKSMFAAIFILTLQYETYLQSLVAIACYKCVYCATYRNG
jgi:hypothetical protein